MSLRHVNVHLSNVFKNKIRNIPPVEGRVHRVNMVDISFQISSLAETQVRICTILGIKTALKLGPPTIFTSFIGKPFGGRGLVTGRGAGH